MNKAIEIEEMRISSDGKNLEFIINAPGDYQFSKFIIEVDNTPYSIGNSLFFDKDQNYIKHEDNRFTGRVPVSLFGVSGPAIYKICLKADHVEDCVFPIGYDPEIYSLTDGIVYNQYRFKEVNPEESKPLEGYHCKIFEYGSQHQVTFFYGEEVLPTTFQKRLTFNQSDITTSEDLITCSVIYDVNNSEIVKGIYETDPDNYLIADAYISDVSHAYHCLMDDILSLQAKCADKEIQDRVIRNYLMLYAHQEALRLGYIDEATKWFNLIDNCFTGICKKSKSRDVRVDCGCKSTSQTRKPIEHHTNCGCRK